MSEPLTAKELERERRYAQSGWESTGPVTLRILATVAELERLLAEARACDSDELMVAELAEAQGKLKAVEKLALEAVCPGCIQKMDEACVDDGCNWGRQALAILRDTKEGE